MSVFKQLQIEFAQMNNKSSENPPVMQAYNKTSMHAASILHRYLYTDTVISFYVISNNHHLISYAYFNYSSDLTTKSENLSYSHKRSFRHLPFAYRPSRVQGYSSEYLLHMNLS